MPTLNWIGKEAVVNYHQRVPFHLLKDVPELACGEPGDGNLIVEGDNLVALKALLPYYAGQVKCIYIDPPYNTGNEGWAYNDNVNSPVIREWLGQVVGKEGETLDRHDRWLCMMYPRLAVLKRFLRPDGSIWVSMDDSEIALLRVLMDNIFGRENFIATIVWQKRYSRENREAIGDVHEYLLVYAADPERFKATRNRVALSEQQAKIYKNPGKAKRDRWRGVPMTAQGWRPNQMYEIVTPAGVVHRPPEGRCWSMIEPEFKKLLAKDRIYFGKDDKAQPSVIRFLDEVEGFVPWTWWPHDEVGHTDEARKEIQQLFGTQTAFDTPKPTRLLERVLEIATNPGDIVLDSFVGSGTTGHAVLKLNHRNRDKEPRRFLVVEEDSKIAREVTAARLRRAAEGYSVAKGGTIEPLGGSFRYCQLGEPLFDETGKIRETVSLVNSPGTFISRKPASRCHANASPPSRHFSASAAGSACTCSTTVFSPTEKRTAGMSSLVQCLRNCRRSMERKSFTARDRFWGRIGSRPSESWSARRRTRSKSHEEEERPMIALKDYQHRVLDSLREFFRLAARQQDPGPAFAEVSGQTFGIPMPYVPVSVAGLEARMPYVCLRVPTGGGKTLLACYAAGLAMHEFMRAERAVVLWLVPSNTILNQTADALRDARHPYRRALEMACGAVEVVTIEEALRLSRAAVDGQTVVIVATIQAFRVEDTTGRKVYEQNGAFAEHLLNLPNERLADLFPGADGKPKPSLVNMLRLRRPIVIVDEAHNARTDLSFATLGNVLPSCIVEFTATPARTKHPSNVLHHVSAAELKAAEMIKLPLRVVTRHISQRDQLLAEAITLRADLEKLAAAEGQATGKYLRPIALLQAERVDACEPLRERLVSDFGISKDEVKISTGKLDELRSISDISSPKNPVRFIITVEKLREGWDCPFAYVLCSLKETRSATAIEQIVGRILRLPGAQLKQHPDLNCAYAFSVSDSITEVLTELREALESNGFTMAEAARLIIPVPQGTLPLGVQPKTVHLAPAEIDSAVVDVQVAALAGKARIDAGKGEITVFVPLDEDETEKLTSCVKTPEAKAKVEEIVAIVRDAEKAFGGSGKTRQPSPYELQLDFIIPLLCVRENGSLFEFESTFLLEHPWKLSSKDASLSPTYNPLTRPTGKAGVVDIAATGKIETSIVAENPGADFVAKLHQNVLALGADGDWTIEKLVGWMDRQIDHRDIPAGESAEFLRKVIRGLMSAFNIADVSTLALDRFRLREEVEARIQEHRESERKASFQSFLLPESQLTVSADRALNLKTMTYEPSWLYEGGFLFKKHYFGPKPGELRGVTPGGNVPEEFECAQFIDGLQGVQFWVRNLARRSTSFRLQTSRDWFYPDFMCQLNDGRVVAVEYKGRHLYESADSQDKRAVGEVWASRSNGQCLFVMPSEGDFSSIAAVAG